VTEHGATVVDTSTGLREWLESVRLRGEPRRRARILASAEKFLVDDVKGPLAGGAAAR